MAIDSSKRPKANIFRSERWNQDHKNDARSGKRPIPVACKIAHSCKACHYINTSYEASLKEKYEKALEGFRAAGLLDDCSLAAPVPSPRMFGYRTHAKLVVRGSESAVVPPKDGERFAIGLFQPESHRLVQLDQCPLHRASINRLLPDLKAELEASPLQPYNETEHSGHVRALAIRASHLTEELMLTFVCTDDQAFRVELKAMVLRLRQKGHNIVSAHVNLNAERTNGIFGEQTRKIAGSDGLRESLCGLIFEIGPTSFFQVNPWQAETIYRRVEQLAGLAKDGAVAWDLYCGTGQMTLLLSQQGYRTVGIEENPQAIVDAEANSQRNQLRTAPLFVAGRVEEVGSQIPSWADAPQLIVVNPSRRGIAPTARQLLTRGLDGRPDSRLLYVSCEAATLLRDLKEMAASGRRLRQLECFDMFPFTEKLEWLAVLQ